MNSKILITLLGLSLFVGCYPGDSVTLDELDIVLTFNNESVDFSTYKTYAITDTIISNDEDRNTAADKALDDYVLNEIRRNLQELNYLEVDPNVTTPDLIILAELVLVDNYVVGGGGCFYGCYCDPWYPWLCGPGYFPPYPPHYTVSFRDGTLLYHMIDFEKWKTADGEISSIWLTGINGIIRDLSITEQRNLLTKHINQSFDQSTYLGTN